METLPLTEVLHLRVRPNHFDRADAARLASGLPILRSGHRASHDSAAVSMRLAHALWAMAERVDVPVDCDACAADIAVALGTWGVIPAELAHAVWTVVEAGDMPEAADRLAGYLALRARFG